MTRASGAPPRPEVGTTRTDRIEVSDEVVAAFASLSGDDNPLHTDRSVARRLGFERRVAHGGILLAELSRIIGTELPGRGALWLGSDIEFRGPVHVGDTVVIETSVAHVSTAFDIVLLDIHARRLHDGATVLAGTAKVKMLEEVMPFHFRPVSEQRVIVSGGTRGLGESITRHLYRLGATVVALYRSDESSAGRLAAELADEGRLVVTRCDVTESADVEALFDFVSERLGGVDSFVHAATPSLVDIPFAELRWQALEDHLRTYLKGAVEITQKCLSHFEAAGCGRIVLVGSEAVQSPRKHWTHYVTAKSAYQGLARALALELAHIPATVNVVAPGLLHTSDVLPDNAKTFAKNATPLKRLVSEDEVAEVVAFLLGKGGSFISGATIPLTGGRVVFA